MSFIKSDKLKSIVIGLNNLVKQKVLVGIAESTTARTGENEGPINNATLGYIHENGSPAANIPARPFLVPGVQDAEAKILGRMKKASQAALSGRKDLSMEQLEAAGTIAEMSVKDKINSGEFEPLKPATIANRRRSRGTKSKREDEKAYADLVAGGTSPADAQAAAGIQPLINTGALRNSITHIVREA